MNDAAPPALEVVSPEDATTEDPSTEESSKMKKQKIKFESELDREDAVIYFQAILDGLRKGRLQLKQADELVNFSPAAKLELEIKASKKDEKEKISFELSWRVAKKAELEVT